MKIAFKPEKLNINFKPKLFAAGHKSLVVVDDANNIYSRNGFYPFDENVKESISTGLTKFNGSAIFKG